MLAIFDLDDTLVDRQGALRRWIEGVIYGECGMSPRPATVARLLRLEEKKTNGAGLMEALGQIVGSCMTAKDLQEVYARSYLECYGYERCSVEALTLLREDGWKVGVATNGSPHRTREKIARSGLETLIDGLCIAEEIGTRKPDAKVLRKVANDCGEALHGWMVGDDVFEDVYGGAAIGLRTAWLRRGRNWVVDDFKPSAEVDNPLDAASLIVRLAGDEPS